MSLLRDKKFMLQVLAVNKYLWVVVAPQLHGDFDLGLLAFPGEQLHRQLQHEVMNGQRPDDYENLEAFRARVFEGLLVHNIFFTVVLPAMSQTANSGCPLAILNQGAETSLAYKKRVAEYLDVPTGKKLRLHRQALQNLDKVLDGADGESDIDL